MYNHKDQYVYMHNISLKFFYIIILYRSQLIFHKWTQNKYYNWKIKILRSCCRTFVVEQWIMTRMGNVLFVLSLTCTGHRYRTHSIGTAGAIAIKVQRWRSSRARRGCLTRTSLFHCAATLTRGNSANGTRNFVSTQGSVWAFDRRVTSR